MLPKHRFFCFRFGNIGKLFLHGSKNHWDHWKKSTISDVGKLYLAERFVWQTIDIKEELKQLDELANYLQL
jgi:hypothetical protein